MKLKIRPALKSYYLCLSPLITLKKKTDTWHPQPPRHCLQRLFLETNLPNFNINFLKKKFHASSPASHEKKGKRHVSSLGLDIKE